jgi:branched-chain amino acid aminotransferase
MPSESRDGILFLFLVMQFISVNGDIVEAGNAYIRTDDRSYRYGEGLFETIKVKNEKILLADRHFERLFKGLSLLKFSVPGFFTRQNAEREILDLCKKNNCRELARVRLSVSGGNGGLYDGDEKFQYIIECGSVPRTVNELNKKGWNVDIFSGAKKSCDVLSNLKSASHLPYVMAARFARENNLDDCFLLNTYNRICDSTIANLFWIKNKNVFTPPLGEGCIAGVVRRYILEELEDLDYRILEKKCELNDLENADEVFLTNAIQGIKWVGKFRNRTYVNNLTKEIFDRYIQQLKE